MVAGFGGDLVNRIKKGDGTMYCHLFLSNNADYVKILRVVFNELKKTVNFSKITVVFLDFK